MEKGKIVWGINQYGEIDCFKERRTDMRLFVKKHYIKVAEILRGLDPGKFIPDDVNYNRLTIFHSRVVKEFSQVFQADAYDQFDLNKFQQACYKN